MKTAGLKHIIFLTMVLIVAILVKASAEVVEKVDPNVVAVTPVKSSLGIMDNRLAELYEKGKTLNQKLLDCQLKRQTTCKHIEMAIYDNKISIEKLEPKIREKELLDIIRHK